MAMARYYQVEILGEDVLAMYHEALKDYSIAQIREAATAHIKNSKWFPKINELIDLLKPRTPQLESIAEQQAAIVLGAIARYGYRYMPKWKDPITAHLFSSRFKWQSLCDSLTDSERKWFVKEFKEAYQAAHDMSEGEAGKLIEAPKEVAPLVAAIGAVRLPERPGAVDVPAIKRRPKILRKYTQEELEEQKKKILEMV